MKRFFVSTLFVVAFLTLNAQNIQLHYDLGKDRQMLTTTVEMFKPDKWGNTFFFIDFDYGGKAANVNGVSLAYWEIAREIKIWEAPVAIHAEYNGGIFRTSTFAAELNNSYLVGPSVTFNNEDFSRVLTLMGMYKYIQDSEDASFQLTAVWGLHFFNRKLSFTGFVDFWKQDNVLFDSEGNMSTGEFVLLSEPQLWYNVNENFSAGGEIEISSNFAGNKGFMVNPTLGLRWTF